MASNYAAIREANKAEYGNIRRWGPDVLVNRYDSSAHFIFEILQNAEDALKRRTDWKGSREVRFDLASTALRVSHFGDPFTFDNVKGVCGIGETTKDLTDIGRFGIGFKSVYSITERPEVHSGEEDFAIENFVFPVDAPPAKRMSDQTLFVFPLRPDEAAIRRSVADGLTQLGPRTLLFLRQIEEIAWSVDDGASGLYLKGNVSETGDGSRRVTLIGERNGKSVVDETWLVFSREAKTDSGKLAGYIEIAFLLKQDEKTKRWAIQRVDASPLNAFFPTIVTTHLGFLVQGPYRTTPSRDNVPASDPWNVTLVSDTTELLLKSLDALKSQNLLDVAALQSLPLERTNYPDGSRFAPLFDAVRNALASKPLLPRADGGWTTAKNARLARTQDLRDLFDSRQLGALLGTADEMHWLSGEITRDTASTLRNYLLYELDVNELTPEQVLSRLDCNFMQAQSDEWILRLYEFLGGQTALLRQGRVSVIPLVRLEDGTHVVAELNGQPQAFLPSKIKTDFPTVRRSVCNTARSLDLLKTLGLTEPDAVDDVVRNILPKYKKETIAADGDEYEADIKRIVNAFGTQHRGQREKLVAALEETTFVMAVDAQDGAEYVSKPGEVYLATERLTELFRGVKDVLLVDDAYACLKGEDVRELLEACGATRTILPVAVPCKLTWSERSEIRRKAGHEVMTRDEESSDYTLRGLTELLALLPGLDVHERRKRGRLLWESLKDLEQRRGAGTFSATYFWTRYDRFSTSFDPEFVRALNTTEWVADADGNLQRPEFVVLESIGWEANPFLESKIRFKPPIIDQLAMATGIDPKVLDLLRKRGLTNIAELVAALGDEALPEPTPPVPDSNGANGDEVIRSAGDVDDAINKLLGGESPQPTPPIPDPSNGDPTVQGGGGSSGGGTNGGGGGDGDPAAGGAGHGVGAGTGGGGNGSPPRAGGSASGERTHGGGHGNGTGTGDRRHTRTPGSEGGRPFVSYIGVHPHKEEADPDGLAQDARMALEDVAIRLILSYEPSLKRMPAGNKGFDLIEPGPSGTPTKWIEAKAMTGGLINRPVGMSDDQFLCALEHRNDFWLYVVEHAGTAEARIVRIQDPAGKAKTFTFDHGWLSVAEITQPREAALHEQSDKE